MLMQDAGLNSVKNSTQSQKGFSLIELMVVVAILGILATIAVPQVNKFMAKARQAEVKSLLAALYTSEKAFYTEYNTYWTGFNTIGFAPEGKLRYNVGFGTASTHDITSTGLTTAATPASTGDMCGGAVASGSGSASAGSVSAACTVMSEGQGTTLNTSAAADASTFKAEGQSKLVSSSAAIDTWTIDQNKTLAQTVNGIP